METAKDLITEIAALTREIETNYPEIYEHLDENPMTIPSMESPKVDAKELESYLNSLKELVKNHKEKH